MSDVIYVHSSIYVECSLDSAKAKINNAVKKVASLASTSSFEAVSCLNYTQNGTYHKLFTENISGQIEEAWSKLENVQEKLNSYIKLLQTGPDELAEIDHECKNDLTTWNERLSYHVDSFKEDINNSGGVVSWLFSGAVAVSSYINTKIDESGSVFKFFSDTWEKLKSPADGWIENHPVIGGIIKNLFYSIPVVGKKAKKVDNRASKLSSAMDREELQEGNDAMDNWNARANKEFSKGNYKKAVEYAGLGALSGFAGILNTVGAEVYETFIPEDARELISYHDNYMAQAGADLRNGDYVETVKDIGKGFGLGLMAITRIVTDCAAQGVVNYYFGPVGATVYNGITKGLQWLTNKFFEY